MAFEHIGDIARRVVDRHRQPAAFDTVDKDGNVQHHVIKTCDHDWQPTDNWLIDRCTKCGAT